MNENDLARNIIRRATGSGRVIHIPEMSNDDYIAWLDWERLPERVWQYEHYPPGGPGGWVSDDDYQWCRECLAIITEAYHNGEMSDEDFIRLTTKREFTSDEHHALRERASRFVPNWFYRAGDGREVFTLLTDQGEICITPQGDQWVLFEPNLSNAN